MDYYLSSAPSTDNPCLLILRDKGYVLKVVCSKEQSEDGVCVYIAEKDGRRFAGNSGPELLGLVTLWENYGESWNRQSPDIMGEVIVNEEDGEAGAVFN